MLYIVFNDKIKNKVLPCTSKDHNKFLRNF